MSKLGEAILKKLPSALAYDNLISIDMVKRRLELREILKKYPVYIPFSVVAKVLNMKPEWLRACIKQGRCPFGLGYEVDDKSAFKIPTETFFLWYTHAVIPVGI